MTEAASQAQKRFERALQIKQRADDDREASIQREISAFFVVYPKLVETLAPLSNEARRRVLRSVEIMCEKKQ